MSVFEKIASIIFADGLERCNRLGLKIIAPRPVEQFLDIGCGNGSLTTTFASRAGARKIYGIEIDPGMLPRCEARGIRCSNIDLKEKWSFESDRFDLILSSQNIEHITNTRVYLEECHRCLKPGGQIIIMTENFASWANIFALIFGW
ncbi:MAG: class I SAM-dependent methyltransferase [Kiritimatiellae bacterium]|nr:class I SAM-dependent methyltransferase [Kiritimatiellia bacterium]MDD5521317.1 class I SAM-dependent methyltransferase [Kiritimatiellia bacterium]